MGLIVTGQHLVIRVDMTKPDKGSLEEFNVTQISQLRAIAKSYEVELDNEKKASVYLDKLVSALNDKHGNVVILIDEYDKPILDDITNEPLAEGVRNTLRRFYSTLKAQDENLRFVMMTGITKFPKVSVFSGLNNLHDISLTETNASLCGYTQQELEQVFEPWIKKLSSKRRCVN